MRRRRRIAGAAGAAALAAVALGVPAHAGEPLSAAKVRLAARAAAPAASVAAAPTGTGSLDGDSEAFAVRIEYDIPLPAGTGTIPHVVGNIGRSNGTDNVHGLAGAPSHLDAVVGGQYANPNGASANPVNNLPQAECYSPGPVPDAVFRFPTDTQAGTSSTPPTAVATVQCAAGPTLAMHAFAAGIGRPATPSASLGPVVTSGTSAADGTAGPSEGHLVSDAAAYASGIDILGGLVHIASLRIHDRSTVDGRPGQAASAGSVEFSGMTVAGTPAALANDVITVAGQSAPVDSTQGRQLVHQLNAGLSPSGCALTVLDTPSSYPQGFLLSRHPPKLGVAADGSSAASEIGGMLLLCDVPQAISSRAFGFSPQRMQVVLGFAYTAVSTRTDPGGFGLANLGGSGSGLGSSVPSAAQPSPAAPLPAVAQAPSAPAAGPDQPPPPLPIAAAPAAAPRGVVTPAASVLRRLLDRPLGTAVRASLFAACLAGWLLLSMVAIRGLRGVTAG